MFKRTKIQLTIVNSLVFILLMGVFGFIIYLNVAAKLYKDVDATLQEMKKISVQIPGPIMNPGFFNDPRIDILVWAKNKELILTKPENGDLYSHLDKKEIRTEQLNVIENKVIEGYHFRTIAFETKTNLGYVTIQLVRNIDSEKEMLDLLLLIFCICGLVGSIFAIVSGYFLAGRALIPIDKAWKKQKEFVSDASHELRTPLTIIQSRMELILKTPFATVEEKSMDVLVVLKESRRLSKLITNLLLLARSDSDQLEVYKTLFHFDILVNEIVGHYSELAKYKGKSINLEVESPLLFIGDKERLHQLIIILLDNSMKFTDENGLINIICKRKQNAIILIIKDNGLGIQKKNLHKIFNRFYQENPARTIESGSGLGLAIAQWIIDSHNGQIEVKSDVGKGTTVSVLLPIIKEKNEHVNKKKFY